MTTPTCICRQFSWHPDCPIHGRMTVRTGPTTAVILNRPNEITALKRSLYRQGIDEGTTTT